MDTSQDISKRFWPIILAVMVAASIWASPFRYDYGNGGRYLTVVAQRMDPGLFPGDPVVAALTRFDSLFYRVLPMVLSGPENFESDLFKIFVGMKIALVLSLFWLVRTLTKEPLAAVLLLAWCSQGTSALLGGVALFANTATHGEVVLVLGILAVFFAVQRRYWAFWSLIYLGLFIHSLMTVHLLACVFPVMLWSDPGGRTKLLIGLAGFSICFLAYLHWMTPPSMSPEEVGIFIRAKGDMQHVSPRAQGAADYLKFGLTLALAVLGQRRWLSSQAASRLLIKFAICGAMISFALGFAAVYGRSSSITQLQPMRIFYWVTLFLEVIIAWAAGAALQARHPFAWAFLGVIVFAMTESLWADALMVLAIAGVVLDPLRLQPSLHRLWVRVSAGLPWVFAVAATACALSGNRGPFQSLRDPWLMALGLGVPLLGEFADFKGAMAVALVFGLCLCAAGIRIHHDWTVKKDSDLGRNNWLAACNWCRQNSAKDDLFLTPPAGDNFRLHALRSSIGEEMSALAWVAPRAFETNRNTAAKIGAGFKVGRWDLTFLRDIARTNGAKFVLVDGPFIPSHQAVFTAGGYSIHQVNDR